MKTISIQIPDELYNKLYKAQIDPPSYITDLIAKSLKFKDKKDKIKIGSHFEVTLEQRKKLITDDGIDTFKQIVENINDYCSMHGKKYKDYAAAYRTFRKRATSSPSYTNGHTRPEPARRAIPNHQQTKEMLQKLNIAVKTV